MFFFELFSSLPQTPPARHSTTTAAAATATNESPGDGQVDVGKRSNHSAEIEFEQQHQRPSEEQRTR